MRESIRGKLTLMLLVSSSCLSDNNVSESGGTSSNGRDGHVLLSTALAGGRRSGGVRLGGRGARARARGAGAGRARSGLGRRGLRLAAQVLVLVGVGGSLRLDLELLRLAINTWGGVSACFFSIVESSRSLASHPVS